MSDTTKKTRVKKVKKLIVIGTTDVVDLPDYGITNLPCKVDTGADSSAIHCDEVMVKKIDGKDHLIFKLLDKDHPLYTGKEIAVTNFKEKKVRSSFGNLADRFQVKLTVKIFGKQFKASFNLSSRPDMRYPVLLGRRFLKNHFIVDVSKKNLNQQNKVLVLTKPE
ncbi:MAG: hypothetical protein GC181_14625 [Bacteroidetes bacterium]|nr:hypothetical protein [Bacteroidota bacterium]